MRSKFRFLYKRLGEKLWIRPLTFCLLAVFAAFAAAMADRLGIHELFPKIEHDTVEKLLSIIAASMLGVATFAVGSMVSAYASVSNSATPRAFTLVISDDVSKTALSTFVAAFGRVLPVVRELSTRHPERTIFTRFIPPERPTEMPGMWQRYYARWKAATREELVPSALHRADRSRRCCDDHGALGALMVWASTWLLQAFRSLV